MFDTGRNSRSGGIISPRTILQLGATTPFVLMSAFVDGIAKFIVRNEQWFMSYRKMSLIVFTFASIHNSHNSLWMGLSSQFIKMVPF